MFYSHEILTSRKHGVATIWLVATLGSKSTLKKVNRKAISQVDIPKACEVILAPETPMALRLQSHLLYGVSRVFNQQCGYVLLDAQNTQNSIRHTLKNVTLLGKELDLDPEAAKSRPDSLLLQDDPAFVPDLAFPFMEMNPDLSELRSVAVDTVPTGQSSLIQRHSVLSKGSSSGSGPRIVLPASDSAVGGSLGRFGEFEIGDGGFTSSTDKPTTQVTDDLAQIDDDTGFLPGIDFGFDTEGNIYDIEQPEKRVNHRTNSAVLLNGSDAAAIQRVRDEHERVLKSTEGISNGFHESGMTATAYDFATLPDATPFPDRIKPVRPVALPSSPSRRSEEDREDLANVGTAAMGRKLHAHKIIKPDSVMELRNSIIANWNSNYVFHMSRGLAQKLQRGALALSKKNAEYWIWGSGIGAIGRDVGLLGTLDPLAMFYGNELMERITGLKPNIAGQKRPRNNMEQGASDYDERRVRSKSESVDEIGRVQETTTFAGEEKGFVMTGEEEEPEVGRNEPTPPPGDISHDASSIMPWNLSASQRSSTAHPSRRLGISSRAGSVGSAAAIAARFTSASPLIGRGSAFTGHQSHQGTIDPSVLKREPAMVATPSNFGEGDDQDRGSGNNAGDLDMPNASDLNTHEEFELFGTSAHVSTQTAQQSQWVRIALDTESENFLEFVRTACAEKDGEMYDEVQQNDSIEFATLLPPETNSRVVAAQGLLHCLSLMTKRLLGVLQEDAFGPIILKLME